MTLLNVIAFLGLLAGSFILLSINPLEFAESISKIFKSKEKTLKEKVIEVTKKKKTKGLKLLIEETKRYFRSYQ